MSTKKIKIFSITVIFLIIVGLNIYQLMKMENMKKTIENSEDEISELKEEQIINKKEKKALSVELEEKESDHLESLEKIESFEGEVNRQNEEIEKLEKDLLSKKEKEAKEEEVRLAKIEEEKSVKTATSSRSAIASGTNLGTFEATAYGADCVGCSGITANGTDIRNGNIYVDGYRVIASDPRVIPMNSIVKITYSSGKTEMAKVSDSGGKIKGKIIDIAFATEAETPAFGRQQVQIELIK